MQRRQWQPTPVLLPGKSHGQRSLVGCSPWGHKESDTTERLHFHFSLACIEENGNPLQCSSLENPTDGRAWWAAVYGVAQSRTLKRLSSSMYGCESWTIKKAECRRIDAFELWCWRRLLKSPLDCKEIQPVHPKGDQSWVFIGRIDTEAETPILWPPDAKN